MNPYFLLELLNKYMETIWNFLLKKSWQGNQQWYKIIRDSRTQMNTREKELLLLTLKKSTHTKHTFNMLLYMSLIQNIFELEYTIHKINSSGRDIFALEKSVYSGQLFWSDESSLDKQELYAADESSHVKESVAKPQTISTKIIKKIVEARRVRRHLYDDLQIIKENLQGTIHEWERQWSFLCSRAESDLYRE